MSRLMGTLGRCWRARACYARDTDWAASLMNRLLMRVGRRLPSLRLADRSLVKTVVMQPGSVRLAARLGSTDFLVLEEMFFHQEYDIALNLPPGEMRQIVDLGSNCGVTVALWVRRFPDARILAIEPDPKNYLALVRNVKLQKPTAEVVVKNCCVAATDGALYLSRVGGEEWAVQTTRDAVSPDALTVPAYTLPRLLKESGFVGELDLLKCDIEGAEQELFADCADWLPRVRHAIVEIHAPYRDEQFRADVARGGDGRFSVTEACPGVPNLYYLRRET